MILKNIQILLLIMSTSLFAQTTIISEGSNWNYLDDGSNQGETWYGIDFDDSSWNLNFPAQFGYGETVATEVSYGPVKANKYPTTYFRKSFEIADSTIFDSLTIEAIRDDGMVVYLNGVEIWSNNMPETFDWSTYAILGIGGANEGVWISKTIENSLITGTNVIAVEIHQATASSSDLAFDLKLTGSSEYLVKQGANWNYLDDGSNQSTAWYGADFDDSTWNLNFPAQFGYGETQATEISYGPSSSSKYITTYFRKSFEIEDHTLYSYLLLEAIRDDGMVVYLNGVEVWSDNMPEIFDSSTYASSGIGTSEEGIWISKNIESSLITGTNVIAVEIHQATASSSDLAFDFRLKGFNLFPTEVTRGPYLQKGTSTSVVVRWRTNNETESVVKYGTSLGALNSTVEENTLKTEHEITIDGLNPNTKYYYEVADSENVYVVEDSEMFYKTAPEIGTKQFVRAWILGDPGTASQRQKNVRDQYYNYVNTATNNPEQTDMMLFLGDNAYKDGTDEEYQKALFDIYPNMLKKSVAWSTLGNHDGGSASSITQSGVYYDVFTFPKLGEAGGISSNTEAYYSFDYANIHFIVLESHELSSNDTQMDWCLSDIQATTQDWIVVLFHHPIYSKGSHDSDNTAEYRSFEMRENFQPILEENGVDLVLNGHSHAYERSYFMNGHYGTSDTFNAAIHTVGTNGDLSGKADTNDGAYIKSPTDTEGAVYITTGSAGHNTGGDLNHNAMYSSLDIMGSCVLETTINDGLSEQTLTVKFVDINGEINDYFTINKKSSPLTATSIISNEVLPVIYPVPTRSAINIQLNDTEIFKKAKIYNLSGALVKESIEKEINMESLTPGTYMIEITSEKNKTYHKIVIGK